MLSLPTGMHLHVFQSQRAVKTKSDKLVMREITVATVVDSCLHISTVKHFLSSQPSQKNRETTSVS